MIIPGLAFADIYEQCRDRLLYQKCLFILNSFNQPRIEKKKFFIYAGIFPNMRVVISKDPLVDALLGTDVFRAGKAYCRKRTRRKGRSRLLGVSDSKLVRVVNC